VPVPPETAGDHVGQIGIVLDYQETHGTTLRGVG
jgi:hypothetical protein